jgi:hypothetical protein
VQRLADMTFEELHQAHRELWGWLAETGRSKGEWPGWQTRDVPASLCYPCLAAQWARGMKNCHVCSCCPVLEWGGRSCGDGIYGKWLRSPWGSETRKVYAREIARLPWTDRSKPCE